MFETTYVTDASLFAVSADVSCVPAAKANSSRLQEVSLFSMTFSGKFITNIQCVFTSTEEIKSVGCNLTVFFYFRHSSDSGSKTTSRLILVFIF